jgi:large subunit ribosomal protein L25
MEHRMATDTLKLNLQPRTVTGKEVKKLRREGIIPLGVFGRGIEPFPAQTDEREFVRTINQAGYTGLIELVMDGQKSQQAFLQELQRHPVTGRMIHADLKVVDVNRPIELEVPIIATGENKLVEKGEATLNHNVTTLLIRALPTQVPHQIDVDVSALVDFDQTIHVRDLVVPGDVEVLSDPEGLVFALSHIRVEEEVTEAGEGEAEGDAAGAGEE